MDTLPNELLLKIAEYLSYEDVDNFRRVCTRFHSLLNTNELWQRLYISKFDRFKNLSALESRLEFNYELDEVSGDSIEPCLWMRRFGEELRLLKNFDGVNFVEELVPCLESSLFVNGDDKFVFTSKINNNVYHYEQWNIEQKICEKEPIWFAFTEIRVAYFEVLNDIAVLIQGSQPIVQIFKNINGNFEETDRLDYCDDRDYNFSLGNCLHPKPIKKISFGSFNGQYFLGIMSPHEEPNTIYINVWDFMNMTKIKKLSITYPTELCKVKVNPVGNKFCIVAFTFDNETLINFYCTEKHELIEYNNRWKGIHFFYFDEQSHILKVHLNKDRSTEQNSCLHFNLWKNVDVLLNDFKSETPSGAYVWNRSTFTMPYFGLMQNQRGIGIVYIFDVLASKSYRISLEFYVKNIKFVTNDRILINVNNWNWEPFFYLYSIKKPQIIRSFHFLDLCPYNISRTKLFVRQHLSGELYVYHFW